MTATLKGRQKCQGVNDISENTVVNVKAIEAIAEYVGALEKIDHTNVKICVKLELKDCF